MRYHEGQPLSRLDIGSVPKHLRAGFAMIAFALGAHACRPIPAGNPDTPYGTVTVPTIEEVFLGGIDYGPIF